MEEKVETQLRIHTESEKQIPKCAGAVLDIATYATNFRAQGFIAWSFYKFSASDMFSAFNIKRE